MDTIFYAHEAQVVARRIGDEMVLVPVRQNLADLESLYTLNPVAAALWERLAAPQTAADLARSLTTEYDVAPDTAAADVQAFLAEMTALSLLEGRPDA